jgi:farnesyl-diphosphate farnesyltransferase
MGKLQLLRTAFTHPLEFITLAQFYLYHDQTRDITNPKEFKTSGYDRESMKKCWEFLDKTSRSFAMVIKELDGDLARVVRSRHDILGVPEVSPCCLHCR